MFTVRPAVLGDVDALEELYRQLDEVHAAAEPALIPTPAELPRRRADIEETVRDPMAPMFVAVSHPDDGDGDGPGQVVGFAKVRVRKLGRYWKVETMPEVDELAVAEAARGSGVGRMLMSAAEEWARGAGYPELWVAAWAFNVPAASLYARQGFEPLNTRFRKRLADG
jgi:GNAT superfamily N-acetyltransferase